MPFLPKALTTLVGDDPTLARISANLRQAVQPTLDFLNTYFTQGSDGSLRLLRNTVAQGAFTTLQQFVAQGAIKLLGDVTINGNVYAISRTGNGFVIQPAVAGPAFYVTNVGGSVAQLTVYSDGGLISLGSINGANVNSGAGFKAVIDIGTVWNTSAGAGAYYQCNKVVYNLQNGTIGITNFVFKFPFNGSIVGWSLNNAGPALGQLGLRYYRNGTLIGNPLTNGSGGNNATFWDTHPKGAFSFAAGDTLTVFLGCSNAGNFQASAQLTLEMSA